MLPFETLPFPKMRATDPTFESESHLLLYVSSSGLTIGVGGFGIRCHNSGFKKLEEH